MVIYKCKMCGGTIEFEQGATVGVCDSCGTKQTLPRLDDEKKVNWYDRANHFRRNNDFDKAMGIYEQILNEDDTDAEAYWSLVLCRYGIEYVEEPASHKRIPTINRAQFTSIYMDEDYKSAIRYADSDQKAVYEEEAKAIDEIQKGILEISSKEEPFDVFICYKETDANGRRTQDSVLANELYHELIEEGFKVFFSRITLEDKLGIAYEPYIFAALHSSKVMVVIGTKPEYFNAVWVKNEWNRYLALIKNGEKKMLIPAYRDMDPYDLPEEFSHLQAQDMSKLGFMQDLIRGIKKIATVDTPKETVKKNVVKDSGNTNTNANIAPLLKRVFIFLEDGDFDEADEYCEKVLDLDPECAQAYLGKLMAELFVEKQELLADCDEPFDDCNNYQKIIRFGDKELVSTIKGYIDQINERNENDRMTEIYNHAVNVMDSATTEAECRSAADVFQSISGFKDADVLVQKCLDTAEKFKVQEEEKRIEDEKLAKKQEKVISIITLIVFAIIIFVIVLNTLIMPKYKFYKAMGLLEDGDYDSAYALLEELENSDAIAANKYERAVALLEAGDLRSAYLLFRDSNYNDGSQKALELLEDHPSFAQIGDTVTFGRYEQDNDNANGKEKIEWIVLDKTDSGILIISSKVLDNLRYYAGSQRITWEECSLREWLNSTFLEEAFNTEEQLRIQSAKVTADPNPWYGTDYGNDTIDKVFLLSVAEVNKYFPADSAKACTPTEYAIARDVSVRNGNCIWWLRSPSIVSGYVVAISDRLTFATIGALYPEGVRPALWLNFES
ncbi:DUF6273 domain-containing protein [Hominifimenecus sp. rT4P-3]|uniref:DUF6273 domain-containing protein n=1 Tax=Hominifimenecus sp. rT4P-3 TaxID=3242979 RepID=UPI003DA50D34